MTATQAPTPGPLDEVSTRLLRAGDWIRFKDNPPVQVSCNDVTCGSPHWSFIGRPDESGWMPWSGGENPVPGQMVEVRTRSEVARGVFCRDVRLSGSFVWAHRSNSHSPHDDIIAFRLAPPAPVEASGSEPSWKTALLELKDKLWIARCDSRDEGFRAAAERAIKMADDADWTPLNLRPQPSGETREAVALQVFADEVAKTGVTEDTSGDDAYNALTVIVEYARQLSSERPDSKETDGDLNGHLFRDPIQAAEALLSARPLALGGQQGDGEGEA